MRLSRGFGYPFLRWKSVAYCPSAFCMLLAGMMSVFLAGCNAERDRTESLTKVARDWCLTIRASQVLPVYPLTEDMLPGDILLTTTPIGEEQAYFEAKGFLPMDSLIARLSKLQGDEAIDSLDARLKSFYGKQFRAATGDQAAEFPKGVAFPGMPAVGFPTYNVEISRSAGLNAAIPIQGIPLGLSMLGASSATASVTLKDAYSYGVDIVSLNDAVDAWAKPVGVKAMLLPYGTEQLRGDDPTASSKANFVRVVSRVFLVKKVTVTILSTDSSAQGLQFGGASSPDQNILANKTAAENANAGIKAINDNLSAAKTKDLNPVAAAASAVVATQLPSASIRLAQASRRSVSLDEEFTRPLVIGYLAIDRQILSDGTLGPPLHTLLRVRGSKNNSPSIPGLLSVNSPEENSAHFGILTQVSSLLAKRASDPTAVTYKTALDKLAREIAPPLKGFVKFQGSPDGMTQRVCSVAAFESLDQYLEYGKKLNESIASLQGVTTSEVAVTDNDKQPVNGVRPSRQYTQAELLTHLKGQQAAWAEFARAFNQRPEFYATIKYLFPQLANP